MRVHLGEGDRLAFVAQVKNEDDDFIYLKVAKHGGVSYDVQGGEEFVTLSFTHVEIEERVQRGGKSH